MLGGFPAPPPLVDEKSSDSCELRSEVTNLLSEGRIRETKLLQESWQEEMVALTRVAAVEIVKKC